MAEQDAGFRLNELFDNVPTVVDPPEVRHYIALIDGMIAAVTCTASAADGRIHRSDGFGLWDPMYEDGTARWFRVSPQVAHEWMRAPDDEHDPVSGAELLDLFPEEGDRG